MHQIEKVTPKSQLSTRKSEIPRIKKAIAEIEYALWKNRNRLPLTVEIFVTNDEMKRLRRKYENAGYNVSLRDRYPDYLFTIS
jgi:hypothetical protein